MSTTFLESVLDQKLTRWLPPGDADFNVTLMKSLEEAVRRIQRLSGSEEPRAWKWGETVPLTFRHPLSRIPVLGRFVNIGPVRPSGTGTTVNLSTSGVGPTMRMVVDFANLDNSVQNIALGESGQFFSRYYRDQLEAWYSGRSFPMPFSDAAVEKAAAHKLILQPRPNP